MSKKTTVKEIAADNNGDVKKEERLPLHVLILDHCTERYPVAQIAVDWSRVLKQKQENQHLRPNELLDMALGDVLAGKVNEKTVAQELESLKKRKADDQAEETASEKLKLKDDREKLAPAAKESASKKKKTE